MFKLRIKTISQVLTGLVVFFITTAQAEMRDPTRPSLFIDSGKTTQHDDHLTLSAIWHTSKSKRATINGITVKQGDTIFNNVKILEIQASTVIIKQQGTTQKLSLLSKPIKSTFSTYLP